MIDNFQFLNIMIKRVDIVINVIAKILNLCIMKLIASDS